MRLESRVLGAVDEEIARNLILGSGAVSEGDSPWRERQFENYFAAELLEKGPSGNSWWVGAQAVDHVEAWFWVLEFDRDGGATR